MRLDQVEPDPSCEVCAVGIGHVHRQPTDVGPCPHADSPGEPARCCWDAARVLIERRVMLAHLRWLLRTPAEAIRAPRDPDDVLGLLWFGP